MKLGKVFRAFLGAALVLAVQFAANAQPAKAGTPPTPKPVVNKAVDDPLKGLARDYDKMAGTSWYRHRSSPKNSNSNGFYLYFGKDDDGSILPLRVVARYSAGSWLFVTRAWAKADGQTVDVPQKSGSLFGWERDHGGSGIWEWNDYAIIGSPDKERVLQIANAKSVTVRFEGKQYYNDRTLSAGQLKAMREVISAYEAATGKPWR